MAKMNESELKQDIRDGFVRKIYYLYGEEKMLVSLYTRKIKEKLMGKNPSDFNCHIFNENSTMEDIIQSLDIIPFSANYNYVGIDDFNVEKVAESDFKFFLKALEDIPDPGHLVRHWHQAAGREDFQVHSGVYRTVHTGNHSQNRERRVHFQPLS